MIEEVAALEARSPTHDHTNVCSRRRARGLRVRLMVFAGGAVLALIVITAASAVQAAPVGWPSSDVRRAAACPGLAVTAVSEPQKAVEELSVVSALKTTDERFRPFP